MEVVKISELSFVSLTKISNAKLALLCPEPVFYATHVYVYK